jgi:hypothetical protein
MSPVLGRHVGRQLLDMVHLLTRPRPACDPQLSDADGDDVSTNTHTYILTYIRTYLHTYIHVYTHNDDLIRSFGGRGSVRLGGRLTGISGTNSASATGFSRTSPHLQRTDSIWG